MGFKIKYPIDEYVSTRFGRLVVISEAFMNKGDGARQRYFKCVCDCGNETLVTPYELIVRKGKQSCGCLSTERTAEMGKSCKTHGLSKTKFYQVWADVKQRCYNPSHNSYSEYGGRGILMCDDWKQSFDQFTKDMLDGYKEGLTLDRIDVNGNYTKENCRWVDWFVQSHNKRKKSGKHNFIGVRLQGKNWVARIRVRGERFQVGPFSTELDAAIAYDNISEEHFGDRPNKTERPTEGLWEH